MTGTTTVRPMVRLTALLVRNPALTHEEFLDHWLHHHGPLIASTPELARHILRYEQHVHVPEEWTGGREFDGMTVQWMSSVDELLAFTAEPAYGEVLAPDEERLLDRSKLVWMMTEVAATPIAGDLAAPVPSPPASGGRVGEGSHG